MAYYTSSFISLKLLGSLEESLREYIKINHGTYVCENCNNNTAKMCKFRREFRILPPTLILSFEIIDPNT